MITNTELEYKGDLFPAQITGFQKDGDSVFFTTDNNVILKLTVLRDSLVRFRYTTKGYFSKDFSYAIDKTQSHGYNFLEVTELKEVYQIKTSKIICSVSKVDMRVAITDLDGNCILEDELGFHWEESYQFGGNIVKMSKASRDGESYYGLGDKASHLNLKGKRVENWATDQYAFHKDQEPLYKVVPFYIGLHHKMSYGIFFDNTFRTFFDFCHERRNVTSFWAEGGEMNYYFIYGPDMADVVTTYTHLTGKPEMPPMWALGYHQCKWSYYPESKVKEITSKFRELQIPCDAIYLDIDYMDGFRCFTWSPEYFPDPKRMIAELAQDGFKTVVIIDPGIKIDKEYWVYKEALEKDILLTNNHQLGTPELLFEKIEDAQIAAQIAKLEASKAQNALANMSIKEAKPAVSFDDFTKMDIRIATILEAEKVPKTSKLLKLTVDTGLDKRTVVSGIAEYYKPEEVVGRQVCLLANLAPREIKGITSQGMILMAEDKDGKLSFVSPIDTKTAGSIVA